MSTIKKSIIATVGLGLLTLGMPSIAVAAPPDPYPEVPPTATFHSDGNPILSDGSYYSADAAPLVDDGVLYIYTGHDTSNVNSGSFTMNDYGVFATSDVEAGDWSHWRPDFQPATVYPDWATGQMAYAGHVTKGADGKFYYYTPVQWTNTAPANRMAIGVAVSDTPVGPWTDARKLADGTGTPLVSWVDVFGTSTSGEEVIDPCVFIDDDGRVYLYWGSWYVVRMVELDPDMVHIKAGAQIQTINMAGNGNARFYEAPWVFKKNNIYYLVYDWKNGGINNCTPSNYQACIAYATATSPTGPFSYKGIIMTPGSSTTMHPSVIEFNGQWYITYHTKDAVNGSHFRRSVAIDKLYWDGDTILPVKQTWDPAIDPYLKLRSNVAFDATVSASYDEGPPARITAVNDGFRPTTAVLPPDYWSSYRGTSNTTVTSEWLQYQWTSPVVINSMGIQFRSDSNYGYAPQSWTAEYLGLDGEWHPVVLAEGSSYGTSTSWQNITFAETYVATALRATFQLRPHSGSSAYNCVFVAEWEVNAVAPDSVDAPTVYTTPGTAPALPAAVRVHYGVDSYWAPVNWKSVDAAQYAAEGSFTVDGRAAGYTAALVSATVMVDDDPAPPVTDTTAPTVAITLTGTQGQEGWYSTNVIARVSADDDVSYLNTISTKTGSGSYTDTADVRYVDVTVSTSGTTTVYGKAKDAAGNESAEVSATVKIDKVAPTISGTADTTDRTITLTASDALSGVDTVEYRWDGEGSWLTYTGPVTAPDLLAHQLQARATDKAGLSGTTTVDMPRDPAAPMVRENVAPYATPTGSGTTTWNTYAGLNDGVATGSESNFWGTWGLTPSGSAETGYFHYVMYTWSSAQWIDELNVIWYRNNADSENVGMIPPTSWVAQYCPDNSCTVTSDAGWIDITPTGTTEYTRNAVTSGTNPDNTVTFDPISVTKLRLKMQNWGGANGSGGAAGIREWLVYSSTVVPSVNSISIAPTAATVAVGGSRQFTATIDVSGLSDAVTWAVSGGTSAATVITSTGGLVVGADETATSLTVTVTSVADPTKSASATVTVTGGGTLDTVAPTASIAVQSGTAGSSGWYTSNVTVRVSASDDVDALLTISTKVGSDAYAATPAVSHVDVALSDEGTATVYGKAKDAANNESAEVSLEVKIDKTAPSVSATLETDRSATVTATDATSGVASVEYRFDGTGSWTTLSGTSVAAPDSSAHTLNLRATDVAGLVGTGSLAIPRDTSVPLVGNIAPLATVTSTNNSTWTTPAAVVDECTDQNNTCAWHTWPDAGAQTITLTWDEEVTFDESRVWWFADSADEDNVGVIPPSAWSLEYWDDATSAFVPVTLVSGDTYGRDRDGFVTVHFDAVTTTILRMQITSWGTAGSDGSPGIREWEVYAYVAPAVDAVSISPTAATVPVRGSQTFTATVTTAGSASDDVTWTVAGATSTSTTITDGVLVIGPDETATTLTVTVTSVFDTTKSASATVTVEPLNTDELEAAISQAAGLAESDYTASSWAELQAVLADAQNAIDNPGTIDQDGVDDLAEAVMEAMEALEVRGDTTVLAGIVAAIAGLDLSIYTDESAAGLQNALDAAQALIDDNSDANQFAVDHQVTAVRAAISALQAKPVDDPGSHLGDKTVLAAVVAIAVELDPFDYTSGSFAAVQAKLDAAQAILADPTATQTQVDTATAALSSSVAALVPAAKTPYKKVGTPKISGTAKVGKTLTAKPGTWSPKPASFAYQWFRDEVKIPGATDVTYTLTAADMGHKVSVKARGQLRDYAETWSHPSKEKKVAAGTLTTKTPKTLNLDTGKDPAKTAPKYGETLQAVPGDWGPVGVALTYQWYRAGKVVEGATAATYTLGLDDIGKAIKVKVTGTLDGFKQAAKTSKSSKKVAKLAFTTAVVPEISGTAEVGQTLTAVPGAWDPAPDTLTYQWYRSGKAVKGQVGATYALTDADKGKQITVKVTATKAGYTTVAKTSAKTAKVVLPAG
ncbi:MAG: family 43 glycosylhydrolase [Propionibacteriaceae bacterium]|jgi:hypothetical protein|nr:family 43 glycosylhydrolase [Propionibacteriaceae bacterium]